MPECSYCGAEFDDEEGLLEHLGEAHQGELGAIDKRRVADAQSEETDRSLGPLVLVGVFGLALVVVVYLTVFAGGGSAPGEPGPLRSAHEHGTIEMRVLGEEIDFSRDRYQVQADRFHFEGGDGEYWHSHATGVTLSWAMSTLGIEVREDSVTIDGTTYNESDDGIEVIVEVNGESVDPTEYVLNGTPEPQPDGGDHIRIVVRGT